jgi:hypothetical protein
MASAKQIAANRVNAQRSTGPRTAFGKMKSSRNAFRHGLSYLLQLDPESSAKVDAMTHVLAGEKPSADRLASAAELAQAQLQWLRIRSRRTETISKIEFYKCRTQELRRLAALDRYERYAHTKRRRAAAKFWDSSNELKGRHRGRSDRWFGFAKTNPICVAGQAINSRRLIRLILLGPPELCQPDCDVLRKAIFWRRGF